MTLPWHTLDVHATDGPEADRLHGWGQALMRGFHEGRHDDERRDRWLATARADGARLTGAYPEDGGRGGLGGHLPVATFASFAGELTVGPGAPLPLHMITDVTVAPTHRRQGLLRRMMVDDLSHAVDAGRPVAALTVSEGGIYGRFGFGLATRLSTVEVDATARFALRPEARAAVDAAGGSIVLAEPDVAWPAVQAVFDRHRATTRGAVTRPSFYEPWFTDAYDWDAGGPGKTLRAAVHLGDDGTALGAVLYKHAGEVDGVQTLDIVDLTASTPAGYLALWAFVASLDLVDRVRFRRGPADDPLPQAVTDPRVVRTVGVRDLLWVRILDVVRCLQAREWRGTGAVVLDVADRLDHAAGRWRVEVADGTAVVSATQQPADVALDVETLGTLLLGDVAVTTLAAAGRLDADPGAVARLAALADLPTRPYTTTGF